MICFVRPINKIHSMKLPIDKYQINSTDLISRSKEIQSKIDYLELQKLLHYSGNNNNPMIKDICITLRSLKRMKVANSKAIRNAYQHTIRFPT